jgi:O-antigen ligase
MTVTADITRKSVHLWIYYGSLCLFVIFLPSSRYMLTVSEVLLICNWLAEADFKTKFNRLRSDKPAQAFILIYVLNVIGLLWSEDPGYAFKNDLLHKLPTLFLPLIVATSPVPDRKKIRILLLLFVSSVLVVSFIGFFSRILHSNLFFREASPFIPGLYLGIMLIIAAFQLPLLVKQMTGNRMYFYASLAISAWLIFFLFYLRALSGIASFVAVLIYIVVFLIKRSRGVLAKISVPAIFILLAGLAAWPLVNIYKQINSETATDFSTLASNTAQGTPYLHDTVNIIRENGNLVYIYIADVELRDAWNEKSDLDFDGNDLMNQELRSTLYRYMASLSLKKDRQGFEKLSDTDIRAIEKGTTNYLNVRRPGFYIRAYEEMMSLKVYYQSSRRETSWGSLTKRIDLWRASLVAFRERPVLGWGTGGILKAVDYGIEKNGSTMSGLNLKPHSQYLYVLLTLGLTGLIITVMLYVFFIVRKQAHQSFMFILFLIVFLVNFTGNNSFESQSGQNLFVFFSLFYGYFYPGLKKEPGFIY